MRLVSNNKKGLLAWLLAAALLLVATGAIAHEFDHALDHHQELCALHLYAGHHNGLPSADVTAPPRLHHDRLIVAADRNPLPELRPAPYAARAPPLA
jgi:hypothetical protein